MARFQRGSLRTESRKEGNTWVLRYFVTRELDGRRVEHTLPIGLVRDLPSKSVAWAEVERQHLSQQLNNSSFQGRATFANLAEHYMYNELSSLADTIAPKARSTIYVYRHILNDYLIPRWGKRAPLAIEPLEIEKWLQSLHSERGLSNPTLDKTRRVMSLVYKHAQRHGLIPRNEESNPLRFVRCKTTSDYEAIILTPEQAFTVLIGLPLPERTLTLLAAGTGLRISECLGLQWQDVDFANQRINVRRTWVHGYVGEPKTKSSKAPVPLHPLLAESVKVWQLESPYSQPSDWMFPSLKLRGKKPRCANMLVRDYLRPAAVRAGVLGEDSSFRFGYHNLRHSLASFLVRTKTDPKTVQNLLRHANVKTTLQLYAHSMTEDRLTAQGQALAAFLQPPAPGAVH
jgi:integrase